MSRTNIHPGANSSNLASLIDNAENISGDNSIELGTVTTALASSSHNLPNHTAALSSNKNTVYHSSCRNDTQKSARPYNTRSVLSGAQATIIPSKKKKKTRQGWSCTSCTLFNSNRRRKCEICRAVRPLLSSNVNKSLLTNGEIKGSGKVAPNLGKKENNKVVGNHCNDKMSLGEDTSVEKNHVKENHKTDTHRSITSDDRLQEYLHSQKEEDKNHTSNKEIHNSNEKKGINIDIPSSMTKSIHKKVESVIDYNKNSESKRHIPKKIIERDDIRLYNTLAFKRAKVSEHQETATIVRQKKRSRILNNNKFQMCSQLGSFRNQNEETFQQDDIESNECNIHKSKKKSQTSGHQQNEKIEALEYIKNNDSKTLSISSNDPNKQKSKFSSEQEVSNMEFSSTQRNDKQSKYIQNKTEKITKETEKQSTNQLCSKKKKSHLSRLTQQPSSSHNLPDSTTKNSIIEFDCKISKEQISQSISQDLRDSSFEETGFIYDLPNEDDHYELQKQVSLSSNGNVQSNTLFEKSRYINDSKATSYRTKSTKIKNMNSNELNKVLNPYASNEKGLIKNDNTSSSENLATATKASSSLLYSHNRKHNSIVRKAASETMAKRTKVFHARKDNPISLANKVIAKRDNIYDSQAMISNATLYSGDNILNDTMNNEVTISNNSEVAMFKTAGHGSTITLSNEGVSKANKLFGNNIIRKEKEDKPKVYNVSEKSIVTDTNKDVHSVDSLSIKGSKIPGTSMFTTAGKRKSISISNEGILNAKQLFGSDLTLKTPLHSHLPQQSSSSHNLPDSTTKTSTIEFDCKISKEQISQSISQDLRDSSFEETGFIYDLPNEDDHYELQKQVSLSSNGNVQSDIKRLLEVKSGSIVKPTSLNHTLIAKNVGKEQITLSNNLFLSESSSIDPFISTENKSEKNYGRFGCIRRKTNEISDNVSDNKFKNTYQKSLKPRSSIGFLSNKHTTLSTPKQTPLRAKPAVVTLSNNMRNPYARRKVMRGKKNDGNAVMTPLPISFASKVVTEKDSSHKLLSEKSVVVRNPYIRKEMTKYENYKNNLKITPLPMNLNNESYSGKNSRCAVSCVKNPYSKKKMINFMNDYGTVKITPLNMRYNNINSKGRTLDLIALTEQSTGVKNPCTKMKIMDDKSNNGINNNRTDKMQTTPLPIIICNTDIMISNPNCLSTLEKSAGVRNPYVKNKLIGNKSDADKPNTSFETSNLEKKPSRNPYLSTPMLTNQQSQTIRGDGFRSVSQAVRNLDFECKDNPFYFVQGGVKKIPMNRFISLYGPVQNNYDMCLQQGINKIVLSVTSENASKLRFDKYGLPLCFFGQQLNVNEAKIGSLEQIRIGLLELLGGSADLLVDSWISNHLRWIIWKLASFERCFPVLRGQYLTYSHVLYQLKYRFEKEIRNGERPALRRVLNRDVSASCMMVLCVSKVLQKKKKNQKYNKNNLKDVNTFRQFSLELTDGWYHVPAVVDEWLEKFIDQGKIRVGSKLVICNAILKGENEGIDPLDVLYTSLARKLSIRLEMCANSTRLCKFTTKVRFVTQKSHKEQIWYASCKEIQPCPARWWKYTFNQCHHCKTIPSFIF